MVTTTTTTTSNTVTVTVTAPITTITTTTTATTATTGRQVNDITTTAVTTTVTATATITAGIRVGVAPSPLLHRHLLLWRPCHEQRHQRHHQAKRVVTKWAATRHSSQGLDCAGKAGTDKPTHTHRHGCSNIQAQQPRTHTTTQAYHTGTPHRHTSVARHHMRRTQVLQRA